MWSTNIKYEVLIVGAKVQSSIVYVCMYPNSIHKIDSQLNQPYYATNSQFSTFWNIFLPKVEKETLAQKGG